MKSIVAAYILMGLMGAGSAHSQGIEAGSWGGKVRSGPGTQYQQVGSLRNGDLVQLLEDTRVMMNGYPWYRISYKNGRSGYKWGGILCGYGNGIGGTFGICERDNRRAAPVGGQGGTQGVRQLACFEEGRTRSLSGDVATQITFTVIGENDETQFKIYWLDYNGKRQFYKHVFAGDSYRQSTFVTHPWIVTAPVPGGGEDCIAIYMPGSNPQSVVLR